MKEEGALNPNLKFSCSIDKYWIDLSLISIPNNPEGRSLFLSLRLYALHRLSATGARRAKTGDSKVRPVKSVFLDVA
jgi:hypothetical protein